MSSIVPDSKHCFFLDIVYNEYNAVHFDFENRRHVSFTIPLTLNNFENNTMADTWKSETKHDSTVN